MKKLILTVAFLAATLAPAMAAEPCSGTNCNKVPEPVVTAPPQAEPGNCGGSGCPRPSTDAGGFQPAAAGTILIAPPVGGSTIVIAPPAGGK